MQSDQVPRQMSQSAFFGERLGEICTDMYKVIYGSPPFPFWFLVNCLYWCLIVRASQRGRPRALRFRLFALISSSILVFGTRAVLASSLRRTPPIVLHPSSMLVFLVIFVVFQLFPDRFVDVLVSPWVCIIAFLQGINQMRLFTLCLRNITSVRGFFSLLVSGFVSTVDLILESILRAIFDLKNTHLSGPNIWLFSISVLVCYWALTHHTVLWKAMEPFPIVPTACAFALIAGLVHGIALSIPERLESFVTGGSAKTDARGSGKKGRGRKKA
jgi:hypothetical protein